jgi:hypothetical protein
MQLTTIFFSIDGGAGEAGLIRFMPCMMPGGSSQGNCSRLTMSEAA